MAIIEFELQKKEANNRWYTMSFWNCPHTARNRAREAWEQEPASRPDVRVIRKGSSFTAYLFKGGLFRKNFGKWQRIPARRIRELLTKTT
jgi:hypothetical protein